MNDFREEMTIRNEVDYETLTEKDNFRMFDVLEVGDYLLSIQASSYHYCTPKKNLEDIKDYDTMEVAIFYPSQSDLEDEKEWCCLEDDSFFDEWEYREEFLMQYDGMVGAYIPIKILQSLCDFIENN